MGLEFSPADVQLPDASLMGSLLQLISTSAFLCFFSHSDELFDCIRSANTIPYATFDEGTSAKECTHVVFLDATSDDIIVKLAEMENLSRDKNVIIANQKTQLDLDQIESSSHVFQSSNVTILQGNATLYLSFSYDFRKIRRHITDLNGFTMFQSGDLHGLHVCSLVRRYRFSNFEKSTDDTRGFTTLYQELADHLNFVYTDECASQKVYFTGNKNNRTLNSIYNKYRSYDVDVGFNWNSDRVYTKFRNVGPVITDYQIVRIVRRPVALPISAWSILTAYNTKVWVLLGVSFLITGLAFWVFDGRRKGFLEVFLTLLGPLLLTGSTPVRSHSGLIIVWWSLFAFFNALAFTSDILSLICLPTFTPRVDTEEDFVKGGYHHFFESSKLEEFAKRRLVTNPLNVSEVKMTQGNEVYWCIQHPECINSSLMNPLLEGDDRIMFEAPKIGPNLFLTSWKDEAGEFPADLGKFRVMNDPQKRQFSFISINVNRDLPIHPVINEAVQRMVETGISDYHKRAFANKLIPPTEKRLFVEEDHPVFEVYEQLTATNMKALVWILAIGVFLSICLLLFELVSYSQKSCFFRTSVLQEVRVDPIQLQELRRGSKAIQKCVCPIAEGLESSKEAEWAMYWRACEVAQREVGKWRAEDSKKF